MKRNKPQGHAAVPVGGGAWPSNAQTPRPIGGRRGACGAWPGFETTRRAKLAARTASGRAGYAAAGDLSGPQANKQEGRRPPAHPAARPIKATHAGGRRSSRPRGRPEITQATRAAGNQAGHAGGRKSGGSTIGTPTTGRKKPLQPQERLDRWHFADGLDQAGTVGRFQAFAP